MGSLIFALFALLAGLTAYGFALSATTFAVGMATLFLVFLCFVLRRRRLAIRPLAATLEHLRGGYCSKFGQTPSCCGSASIGTGFNDFMEAVTDPMKFVTAKVLEAAFSGLGAVFRGTTNAGRLDDRMRMEAAIAHTLRTIQRKKATSNVRIAVAAVVSSGVFAIYAANPPGHRYIVLADAPAYMATAHDPPSEMFMTVTESQRAAVRRYPALGVAGSPLNVRFVARCQLYRQTRPGYFRDASWPVRLAEELAQQPQAK